MIRLLLADDQTLVRNALATMLDLEPDLTVVGQAGSCAGVLEQARALQPDVVLMDVQMPGNAALVDGIATTAALLAELPQTRVIVVTTFGRAGWLRRAMEAGAVGYLVKDAPVEQLVEAIRRVHQGLRAVDPDLAAASLSAGPNPLSEREQEVLAAAADARTTAEIARRVFLSEGTVRNHLSAAIGKLGVANRGEAVRVAVDNGWLPGLSD
ncbi:DNA-binding response regulator [Enemella dayhoffiae]|uniref:DNA-binding response regulator n=1 Tax=Enemella dayhoffiae TaxID=2016507 RepID=A0A255GYU5_9ACTN|nr:response regulator transcription factor [Enemella dayhoffiae]OYO20758.1 DNA-binding response regulator [Enemella dayhoffiae]